MPVPRRRSDAKRVEPAAADLREAILAAWKTSDRVTIFLVEQLPQALWAASVPGVARRTVRMIAAHIHAAIVGESQVIESQPAAPDSV